MRKRKIPLFLGVLLTYLCKYFYKLWTWLARPSIEGASTRQNHVSLRIRKNYFAENVGLHPNLTARWEACFENRSLLLRIDMWRGTGSWTSKAYMLRAKAYRCLCIPHIFVAKVPKPLNSHQVTSYCAGDWFCRCHNYYVNLTEIFIRFKERLHKTILGIFWVKITPTG